MKCLVTGGAGFIGSHLAEKLMELGHQVTVLDNLSRGKHYYSSQLTLVKGSVTDKELVDKLVAEHEVVFHLAAILGVKTTVTNPIEMVHNNYEGTWNILQAAFKTGSKVIFASTSEVYGKGRPPFAEDMDQIYGPPKKLRWSYAIGKSLEEKLCLACGEKGLPVSIVRYFNIYGPRAQEGSYGGVVPRFIGAALRGEEITVFGDGTQTRSFMYVTDAVEATIRMMDDKTNQEIVNIGTEEAISINELAQKIKDLTNSSSPIVHLPYHRVFPKGFEEIPNRRPDVSKLKQLLNFSPTITLEEGLQRTITWYEQEG